MNDVSVTTLFTVAVAHLNHNAQRRSFRFWLLAGNQLLPGHFYRLLLRISLHTPPGMYNINTHLQKWLWASRLVHMPRGAQINTVLCLIINEGFLFSALCGLSAGDGMKL